MEIKLQARFCPALQIEKEEAKMAKLKIYTDGACSNNQKQENAGGWGK